LPLADFSCTVVKKFSSCLKTDFAKRNEIPYLNLKLTALKFLLTGIICLIVGSALAQNSRSAVKAPYTRSNAYSHFQTDVFSFSANQATLAQQKNISAGVYGERRFMLQDLSLYQLNVGVPTTSGNFGLSLMRFGGTEYSEMTAGLAYARKLGDKIDLGVQFNYYTINVNTYGNGSAINAEAGVIFHATENLNVGLHVYNPTGVKIGKNEEERLPSVYSFGAGWDASDKLFIGTEVQKEEGQPVNVNAGIQYHFDKLLFARAGVSSVSSTFYLGAGVLLKDFRIDVTASIHPHLGVTPGFMLIYNRK
jgi:hypothetical protein